jgi:hypothetical protein
MEHYPVGREVALVVLQWLGNQLLPTLYPPWESTIQGQYLNFGDFTNLTL